MTDNDELQRKLTHIIQAASADDNAIMFPEGYVQKIMQLFAPTQSSGELEEILKMIDQYSIHKPKGQAKGTLARRELKKRIQKLHATQTTKLQAEARLDELEKLDAQREGKEYKSELFGNPMTVYEVPINLIWNRIAELKREIAQLEREHKIGEDGE